ncbi:hypothetical protein ABZ208_15140 [Streptomyces sp. NPDC006208]|uniref:hypothetical protein n=1 Tax=Streptomyces sp. NPDC006208 TaxID=3156734 RepID=UPI0033AD8696
MNDSMPGPGTEPEHEAPEESAPVAEADDPAAPAPLGVQRTLTGNAEVDVLLERLGDADHLPADGHLEVYEDVHRGLRDALTALDTRQEPQPSPSPARLPTTTPHRGPSGHPNDYRS